MIKNDFYTKENHGNYEIYDVGDFDLEDGGKIPDCKLAYKTFGDKGKQGAVLLLLSRKHPQ